MNQPTQRGDDPVESAHNARKWNVANEEYHAPNDVYGKSMIDQFRESPMLFHGRYVTGTIEQMKSTPSMQFGTMVDRYLLEHDEPVIIPAELLDTAGKKSKKACKAWIAERPGELIVTEREWDVLQRITWNILNHKDANDLIHQGTPQVAIRWTDPHTGLEVKCKPDVLGNGRIVDLKCMADITPRGFANAIERFGYHRQSGHYGNGVELLTGRRHDWFFVCVHNVEPFDVATYTISDAWRGRGEDEINESLRGIAEARKTNRWEPAGYGETLCLEAPRWTTYDDDYGGNNGR